VATRTISITEAKAHLLRLVTEIGDTGDEIVITRRGRAVATLTPAAPAPDLRGWLILPDDLSELWSTGEKWDDPVTKYDRIERALRSTEPDGV
jgi:prevent-host-death family protein